MALEIQENWSLVVPNKMKIFIWRCFNNSLVVRVNLRRQRMRVKSKCMMCGAVEETENHLFFLNVSLVVYCGTVAPCS